MGAQFPSVPVVNNNNNNRNGSSSNTTTTVPPTAQSPATPAAPSSLGDTRLSAQPSQNQNPPRTAQQVQSQQNCASLQTALQQQQQPTHVAPPSTDNGTVTYSTASGTTPTLEQQRQQQVVQQLRQQYLQRQSQPIVPDSPLQQHQQQPHRLIPERTRLGYSTALAVSETKDQQDQTNTPVGGPFAVALAAALSNMRNGTPVDSSRQQEKQEEEQQGSPLISRGGTAPGAPVPGTSVASAFLHASRTLAAATGETPAPVHSSIHATTNSDPGSNSNTTQRLNSESAAATAPESVPVSSSSTNNK